MVDTVCMPLDIGQRLSDVITIFQGVVPIQADHPYQDGVVPSPGVKRFHGPHSLYDDEGSEEPEDGKKNKQNVHL
jgi:hypothetical protein